VSDRRARHRPIARVLPFALCFVAARARADDGWRRIGVEGGIVLEAREVAGSSLHEVRATVHADATPAAILAVLWRHEEQPRFMPHLKHVEVVRDAGDERVVYEQLEMPVLKDRDVVLRVRRTTDPATGTIDVRSAAISDEGPPETSAFVRVRSSAGHWHLVPAGGGTDLTYTIRTDVGLPGWLVNRAQHEAVPDAVHAVIERARAVPATP
jgi:hypothetical protein